jgi:hypothetical protein
MSTPALPPWPSYTRHRPPAKHRTPSVRLRTAQGPARGTRGPDRDLTPARRRPLARSRGGNDQPSRHTSRCERSRRDRTAPRLEDHGRREGGRPESARRRPRRRVRGRPLVTLRARDGQPHRVLESPSTGTLGMLRTARGSAGDDRCGERGPMVLGPRRSQRCPRAMEHLVGSVTEDAGCLRFDGLGDVAVDIPSACACEV